MRAARRRARQTDPLACARAVRDVLESLRASLPDVIPKSHNGLVSMLHSVRHLYARPATDSKRGRPGRFPRKRLLEVDSHLRGILARETSLSVRSFVGQYLPILDFPRDLREALERGDVNLFEAHQLARINAGRLGGSEREARRLRQKVLEAHLLTQESGARLRARVKEILGEAAEPSATETEIVAVGKADELLAADPQDATHLFFEELRRVGRALRGIGPEDVSEEDLNVLMPLLDQLGSLLFRIEKRKRRSEIEAQKMTV